MKNLVTGLFLLFLFSCSVEDPQENKVDGKIKIVCTTSMLGDMAKAIGGDAVEVVVLMGPGVDPHLFKASQGDVQKLSDCDLIIYNGLHLEGKMLSVLEKIALSKNTFVASSVLKQPDILQLDGAADPHIWFDASLWNNVALAMKEQFIAWYPQHEALFTANALNYSNQLNDLHNWALLELQSIPDDSRKLVTAHDAFGYFGRAYNLQVHALQGISTTAEFGLKDMTDLVNFICAEQIPAVFIESSISERSMKAVQEGCAKRNWDVQIGGMLFSDAPGDAGSPESTYIGMFKHNVLVIKSALSK